MWEITDVIFETSESKISGERVLVDFVRNLIKNPEEEIFNQVFRNRFSGRSYLAPGLMVEVANVIFRSSETRNLREMIIGRFSKKFH